MSPAPRPSDSAPLTLGRYAFYGEIASGGMATVHFARLLGPGNFSRIVAAKRLLPHMLKDRDFTAMLMDEARLAARIHHPNVVSTLDVVATGDELVVVMEYVHGESLARLAHIASDLGDAIPRAIATTIVIDALHGLHAAHEVKDEAGALLGLVHRDISPQNLMVGVDGVTRVADFGIAKAAGRSHETRDGTVKGKLSYMAPEQIERGPLTRATDVFALAIVLWELLTGQRLFEGETDGEIVHRILSGPVPAPSTLVPELPPVYDEILARGLRRDPAQRYQTAREMALALEAVSAPARASEIGAWVERVASDSLVRRARAIAKIERAPEEAASAEPSATTKPITPPLGAADGLGTGAGVSWARPTTGRSASRIWLAVAALVLCAAALLWFVQVQRRVASAEAPKSPVLQSAAQPTLTAPAAPVVPSLPTAASALPPSTAEGASAAPGTARPHRNDAAPRSKPSAPLKNCDPPYSIDASGRRIFKLECM